MKYFNRQAFFNTEPEEVSIDELICTGENKTIAALYTIDASKALNDARVQVLIDKVDIEQHPS